MDVPARSPGAGRGRPRRSARRSWIGSRGPESRHAARRRHDRSAVPVSVDMGDRAWSPAATSRERPGDARRIMPPWPAARRLRYAQPAEGDERLSEVHCAQRLVGIGEVGLHRLLREAEVPGDLLDGQAPGTPGHDLPLAAGKRLDDAALGGIGPRTGCELHDAVSLGSRCRHFLGHMRQDGRRSLARLLQPGQRPSPAGAEGGSQQARAAPGTSRRMDRRSTGSLGRVERETGFEPATCSLEGCRSAN